MQRIIYFINTSLSAMEGERGLAASCDLNLSSPCLLSGVGGIVGTLLPMHNVI